jgi:hypothetical protein
MYLSEGPTGGSDMEADEAEFMAIFGGDPEPMTEAELADFEAELDARDRVFRQRLAKLLTH